MGVPAAAGAAVFVAAYRGLTDDALITLSYARTLGLHGDLGMIPGVRANSQTSLLQALLPGGTTAVVRSMIVACGLVWIASMVRNGVLTAVEDAIVHNEDERWRFALIRSIWDGVLIRETSSAVSVGGSN